MIIKNVTFYIKAEQVVEFIDATIENQRNSRMEEGVVLFEFIQSEEESNKFMLIEGYEMTKAMEDHLETTHFKKWINTVEPWFLNPRTKEMYHSIEV
ncbi:putative quinol monooxygenase [Anaeromicropila herbilytica]|uniref:ABM domain-containing protein n=1 Tax=Anaeromicropila herbilytica TaxID=2785025 RepID=A0A7R7EJZ7_9FIRM|nr:antibiotic biosynthesis monooxygenase [Anaeromicropila herbilytica]BCN30159.1 hypothetical protein bsdtb5_14540 [Anaeromicropila herbilytica]